MLSPSSPAAGKGLPPAAIKELENLLQMTQRILNNMSTDARKESPQYKAIEARYKMLGSKLEALKLKQAELARAGRPGGGSGPLPPLARGPYGQQRPAARPGGAPALPGAMPRPGMAAAYGRPAAAPARPAGAPADVAALGMSRFTASMGPAGRPGIVSQGPEVERLQQLLAHLGYQVSRTSAFDPETLRAVQAFQRDRGQLPSGLVGLQMRQLLNQMIGT